MAEGWDLGKTETQEHIWSEGPRQGIQAAIVDPGTRAALTDKGTRAALADLSTRAALADLGTQWAGRQVAPPPQKKIWEIHNLGGMLRRRGRQGVLWKR